METSVETPTRKWHDKFNTWIALISLLVAIFSIGIQLRTKPKEVTCNIISSTELTAVSQIPSLTSSFTYNGKAVVHLWKVSLIFVNSGKETLIGEGPHSTLIADGINFGFTNNIEILNIEQPDKSRGIKIEQASTNLFKLKFTQWLPDEKTGTIIYVTSTSDLNQTLTLISCSRDIENGKVVVKNAPLTLPSPSSSTIERFPAFFRIAAKFTLGVIGLTFVILAILMPFGLWQFACESRWKKRNLDSFKNFLASKGLSEEHISAFVKKPRQLPDKIWGDYPGEKLKKTSAMDFDFDSWSEAIVGSLFLTGLGVIGGAFVFSTVADLFPSLASHFLN